ncbi:MAG TPA: winged helix-turn-helix transcriptional regulator [Nitrososphaeraceae archaeon]|jgi:DNA-binding Lrp family transcriptional regulator|nr:winged helix-turn-helix transcriptional regulator [Nitrososphaeraceae archaeon]
MKPLSSNKNKLVKLPNYDGNVHKLDKKDLIILNEMLANPDVTSLNISKKLKLPLSTVQRRRTAIERSSIVRKSYELDAKQFGWRTADILITVEKGDCVEIANRLLTENIGIGLSSDISKIINKGDNISPGPRVIESSLRIGDPAVNVVARVIYKSSDELFHIIQEIKKMPNIARVEWSEIVKVVGRNNALVLTDSILRYS